MPLHVVVELVHDTVGPRDAGQLNFYSTSSKIDAVPPTLHAAPQRSAPVYLSEMPMLREARMLRTVAHQRKRLIQGAR